VPTFAVRECLVVSVTNPYGRNLDIYIYIYRDIYDRMPGFDSRHYQIFWKKTKQNKTIVVLERGPLSLVSTTEKLLDRKVAVPV
jgi:hypothetical protein